MTTAHSACNRWSYLAEQGLVWGSFLYLAMRSFLIIKLKILITEIQLLTT